MHWRWLDALTRSRQHRSRKLHPLPRQRQRQPARSREPTAEAQEQSVTSEPDQTEADASEPEEQAAVEEPEPEDTPEEEEDTEEAAPAPEPWISDAPLPFDPTVVRGTLSNGLTYYIKHNEEPRDRAQLSLVVRAGSLLEEAEQRGLAHFVEHMAFNGTERFAKQEIVDYIESIGSSFGADLNAGTSYDYTVYWLEFPTDDPEILETAFQILSDWAFAISFEPGEVELERGVVLEEWRLYQGFGSRFQTNLYPAALRRLPLRRTRPDWPDRNPRNGARRATAGVLRALVPA